MKTSAIHPNNARSWLAALVFALVAGGCASQGEPAPSTSSPTETAPPPVAVVLADTGYQVRLPAEGADQVTATRLGADAFPEITPLAVVQLNYTPVGGEAAFLANVFVFDAAYWDSIQDPNTPGYGSEVLRQGDEVVSVQATVDMPFDPESAEGVTYGGLAAAVRVAANFTQLPD